MSKNKNYGAFYPKEENRSYEPKAEEVQTLEVPVEEPQEEKKAEEPKVETPPPAPKPVKIFATVTGGKPCNLRFKANKASQVINKVPYKARVTVLEEKGEWWKVKYRDYTGYMMSQFLKKE